MSSLYIFSPRNQGVEKSLKVPSPQKKIKSKQPLGHQNHPSQGFLVNPHFNAPFHCLHKDAHLVDYELGLGLVEQWRKLLLVVL